MVTFHRTHLKVTTVHLARKATEVECIDQQNHILTFTFSSWLLMISVLQGHGSPLLLLPCCLWLLLQLGVRDGKHWIGLWVKEN